MIAKDQTFEVMRIILDGSSFYGCAFNNCILIIAAQLPFVPDGEQECLHCPQERTLLDLSGYCRFLGMGGPGDRDLRSRA